MANQDAGPAKCVRMLRDRSSLTETRMRASITNLNLLTTHIGTNHVTTTNLLVSVKGKRDILASE